MFNPVANWRNQSKYRLFASKCESCDKLSYPVRKLCQYCHETDSKKMTLVPLPKSGKVISFTKLMSAPQRYAHYAPYTVAVIKLTGTNIQVVGQIVSTDQDAIEIGKKVIVVPRVLHKKGSAGLVHYGIKWKVA